MPTIVALVKHVPDTWSVKTLDENNRLHREGADEIIDEISSYAVEQALRIKEADPSYKVVALAMGPERADEALRKAIAMGADEAVLLTDEALVGSDALATAWALNNAINTIEDVQLVIAGNASSDGATGLVPGIIAEYRQVPALTQLSELSISDGTIRGTRVVPEGTYGLEAPLPAIATVSDKADNPRFPAFKGIMAAKKAEIKHLSIAEIGVAPEQVGAAHAATVVNSATPRPERTTGEIVRGAQAVPRLVEFLKEKNFI
ncbi:MAG: electron transfer flavoprotein subunit beta/FixA family protein [Corynebacterium sp.]|nr:electron transfer flavoprotein subunit beta/FixA family protein [Corynebacterium sp.]